MRLQIPAMAVPYPHFGGGLLRDFAAKIHHANRLHDIEGLPAHRARVHAERATDGAWDAFEKFEPADIRAARFDRERFQAGPGPAFEFYTGSLDLTEKRLA